MHKVINIIYYIPTALITCLLKKKQISKSIYILDILKINMYHNFSLAEQKFNHSDKLGEQYNKNGNQPFEW